jgi:cytochrome c
MLDLSMGHTRRRLRVARALLVLCFAVPVAAAAAETPMRLSGHGGPVHSVFVSEDGKTVLTASFDYSIIRWDIDGETARVAHRFLDHDGAVNDVAATPDGRLAVSASDDGTVGVFDLAGNRLLKRLTGHTAKVVEVAISPDGKIAASAGWDRTARLWDLEKLVPLAVLDGYRGNVNSVDFSPDGARLYTAAHDGTIRSWRVAEGSLQSTVYRYGGPLNMIRLLPGGKRALFGGIGDAGSGFIGVVDLQTGQLAKILQPFTRPLLTASVWPRHGLAAAAGSDGTIRVWDLDTWELKHEYEYPYGPVRSLAISGDGSKLYYASQENFVVGWQISPREAFEPAVGEYPRPYQVDEGLGPGERQFVRKCSICHTLTPQDGNRAGPSLYRVFGREAGTLPGYPYSQALRDSNIVWNEETIARLFDEGPDKVTPGSKMPLQRLKSIGDRDALIAFLKRATRAGSSAIKGPRGANAARLGDLGGRQ